MDLGIAGKTALVTAASRGLGKAVATALAAEGVRVAICGRDASRIEQAARDISSAHATDVLPFVADVTDSDRVGAMIAEIDRKLGGIDICVANAGGPPAGMAADFALHQYREALELNCLSTINLATAVLPHMKSRKWGRIVAITSVAARQPVENLILSNTARAGVLGYLKTLSAQVARDGITVNSVCPGYTKTERVESIARMEAEAGRGTIEEFYRRMESLVPMGRIGTPEEFAAAVVFLTSAPASYITGVALPIDGGWTKALF